MKRLFIAAFTLLSFCLHAQEKHIVINGTVNRLSKCSELIIQTFNGETLTGKIQADNSFVIDSLIKGGCFAFIKTDSSAASAVWVTEGAYNITVNEITMPGIKAYLARTPALHGPQDAEIFNTYIKGQYAIHGENARQQQTAFVKQFLDSVLLTTPSCKALPDILQLGSSWLQSDELVAYKNKITALDSNGVLKDIDTEVQQREATKPGVVFDNFSMKNLDDNTFTLFSAKRKLTLIEFWASWCGPCRASHAGLVELYNKYHDKGLGIISVSLDDDKKDWQGAVTKDGMQWINVSDLNGWQTALAKRYFVYSVPFHLWLDENNKIISARLEKDEIEKILAK